MPFIKGAIDFIKKINQLGRDCFIISATPKKEIINIMERKKINRLFKEVAGSPAVKSENLKYLLDRYSIKNTEAVYFGDARSDYEVAKENKIDFIGIANENNKELEELKEIIKIENFADSLIFREK